MLPSPPRRPPEGEPESAVSCPQVETARLRVAVSPLYTALASLFEVVGGWRRGADERWVAEVLDRAGRVDLSSFRMLAEDRIVPNPLSPVPQGSHRFWGPELEALRSIPAAALLADLEAQDDTPAVREWRRDPEGMRDAFIAGLDAWWRAAIAPEWPRMLALLETEVIRVGRVLAQDGRRAVLERLHPRVRWEGDELVLPSFSGVPDAPLHGRQIVVIPLACGADGLLTGTDDPEVLTLAYAAPGTATLFGSRPPLADPLAEALGGGRATVLRELGEPRSIRDLSGAVGRSPSTVHQHLEALQRADLVHRGRLGRDVLYHRTPRGEQLVALF